MKKITLIALSIFTTTCALAQKPAKPPKPVPASTVIKDVSNLFKKKGNADAKPANGNVQPSNGIVQPVNDGSFAGGPDTLSGVQVTSGEYCSIVLVKGVLYGWGDNSYGQSGNGKSQFQYLPVQITTDNDWKTVSMGGYHTLAIKTDGTLWAWGWGNDSELGLEGLGTRIEFPTRVGRDTDWAAVSTSDGHTVGLKTNGSLWVWGNNVEAGLGVGPTVNSTCYHPYRLGGDNDWAMAVSGDSYTMAIKNDGSLWAWGVNNGNLGTPTIYQTQQVPIRIGHDNDWAKIFTGWRGKGSFGIKKDGSLWVWGVNRGNQLGVGRNIKSLDRPTRLGNDNDWVTIANCGMYTLGIKKNGSLWQWGNQEYDIASPTRINLPASWHSIAVSQNHSIGITTSGRVFTWGGNYYGQLGVGKNVTGAKAASPVEVRNFPVPVITTKSKRQLATVMNEETQLLFGNVKSKLAIKDKNEIARLAGFILSADKKQFIISKDAADYPFGVQVYPTDMNKDGVEEIFVSYGNTYTSGMTGSSIVLFTRDAYGDWHKHLNFPGAVPDALKTGFGGYPDLVIGGPGVNFPVWRWNGKDYASASLVSNAGLKTLKPVGVETLSKLYVASAFHKN